MKKTKDNSGQAELDEFRQLADSRVPGGVSHMSDAELKHLRDMVDPSANPDMALGLIREIDDLLQSGDDKIGEWMEENAQFGSVDEARSYLRQFRELLAANVERTSQ